MHYSRLRKSPVLTFAALSMVLAVGSFVYQSTRWRNLKHDISRYVKNAIHQQPFLKTTYMGSDCIKTTTDIQLVNATNEVTVATLRCGTVNILDFSSTAFSDLHCSKAKYGTDQLRELQDGVAYKHDMSMCTHHPDNDLISRTIATTGVWEIGSAETILAALKQNPGAGLLDLGANIGFISLLAPIIGRQVVSLEALPDNYLRLAKTINDNGMSDLATILPNIITSRSNISYRIKVATSRNFGGTRVIPDDFSEKCDPPLCLKSVTLNDIVDFIPFSDIVMKVDIEGQETETLRSSEKLFERKNIRMVLMEWDHVSPGDRGYLADLFSRRGYSAYYSFNPTKKIEDLSEKTLNNVLWKH